MPLIIMCVVLCLDFVEGACSCNYLQNQCCMDIETILGKMKCTTFALLINYIT